MTKNEALKLLNIHTNKITSNNSLVEKIIKSSPPNIDYKNIKHRLFHIAYNISNIPTCQEQSCKNPVKWDAKNQKYTNTCGYKCSNKITAEQSKDKKIKTNQQKYGGNAPACDPNVINKMKQTSIERYGTDFVKKIHDLSQKSIIKKYGVKNISRFHISEESKKLLDNKQYLFTEHITKKQPLQVIAANLGVTDTTINRYLTNHNIEIKRFYKSAGELELRNFLSELNIEFVTNTKNIIPPHELDIFIPSVNIAIEYNGVYWHSEKNGKTKNFHLNKTELCENANVRLLHIFEDEWRDKKQQCKDTIRHLLGKSEKGVYARNTNIKEITWSQAKQFLNKYHLLGAGSSGNYRIGAFDSKDNLIGVMVFGIPNNERSKSNIIELKRFVTDKKNNPGLGSKMFKFATTQKKYTEIIAFVDRRWFTGLVKHFIGFKKIDITPPAIWWTNGKDRFHRRFVTKKQLIQNNNNPSKSKKQILYENGYYRIWDCGKIKLLWTKC